MRSQTWTPLPPPSPQHLSGSSPCTSPKQAAPYVRHGLAIQFLPDSIHVIIPIMKKKCSNRIIIEIGCSLRHWRASLIAQLVKNLPAMQETPFNSCVRKIHWRRDRLPTPVFLGFPGGLAFKGSACNVGDLGLTSWLGKIPWRRERLPTPIFWPGEVHALFHGVAKN